MIRISIFFFLLLSTCVKTFAEKKTVDFRIIHTTDIHGHFFPYDYINRKPLSGSVARIASYVDSLRNIYGNKLLLLDSGDILQGQPTSYFYNFLNTQSPNIAASVINYMKYDAQTIGNHDIEPGHKVYDKWISEVQCPVLGANVLNTEKKCYLTPYTIIQRDNIKIAVLGMLTPAIPFWLNEKTWSGLSFEDIVTSTQQWVDIIQEKERPDIIIGLFHSGRDGGITTNKIKEDASFDVAKKVKGIDLILYGHDHTCFLKKVISNNNDTVLCINPSCYAKAVGDVQIRIEVDSTFNKSTKRTERTIKKSVEGKIVNIENQLINTQFMAHFQPEIQKIDSFINIKVGTLTRPIYNRDSFFGSAPFTDLIHNLQLEITKADLSFTAPLGFNTKLDAGDIRISDLFNLYKYENKIYILNMTGEEIRKHLELSYDLWTNTMRSSKDHIMQLETKNQQDMQRYGFKNLTFNFDSAAGIDYIVDVTQPEGKKVKILKFTDGRPFDEKKWYKVAMNSYRGNGGGELLTRGAGIERKKIKERIVFESDDDIRYYLLKKIEKEKVITPKPNNNWKFVPSKWTKKAIERDKELIFKTK